MKLTFLFFSALATLFTPASADSSHPFSAPGPDDGIASPSSVYIVALELTSHSPVSLPRPQLSCQSWVSTALRPRDDYSYFDIRTCGWPQHGC